MGQARRNGHGRGGSVARRPAAVGANGGATCDDVRLPELLRSAALTALVRMNGLGGVDEEAKRRLRATAGEAAGGEFGGGGGHGGGMSGLPATMGELLSRHATRLLEVVPRIAADQRHASPRTRGLALLLLQQLTSERSSAGRGGSFSALPLVVKVPHRRHVTRALLRVLDDRNRHVRRLAAALRNEWAVLGD